MRNDLLAGIRRFWPIARLGVLGLGVLGLGVLGLGVFGFGPFGLPILGTGAARAQTAPGGEISVEEFGRLPQVADVAISPDGTKIAQALNTPEFSVVSIVDVDTGKMIHGLRTSADQALRSVGWIDNQLASYTISVTLNTRDAAAQGWRFSGAARQLEYFRVGTVDIQSHRQVLLMDEEGDSWANINISEVMAPIEGDPGNGRIISHTSIEAGRKLSVFRVNLRSGRAALAERGTANTVDIAMNAKGEMIASVETLDEKSNTWALYAYRNGQRNLLAQGVSSTGRGPALFGLARDGRLITSNSYEDEALRSDTDRLIAIDLGTGEKQVFYENPRFDVDSALIDSHSHLVIGAGYTDEFTLRQHFFDADLAKVYDDLQQHFQDGSARLVNWSLDRSRLIVFGRSSGLAPGGYYLYEPGKNTLVRLLRAYPDLPDTAVSPVQSISYKARDGTRIPAYITTPRDREVKNLPMVLLVHGGPHSRDNWEYDFWAQFLASRGYVVLQPNFRGSSGFGDAWQRAGYGQWGKLMQTDTEDGVLALVKAKFVDPKRVCIMGASYGGYAAFAGVAFTPDRYACAVSVNGVADLELMLRRTKEASGGKSSIYDWWRQSIGDSATDRESLRAASPVHFAQAVKTPILVMYSTEDSVVPDEQPKAMIDQLKSAKKDVQVSVIKGEDHWLSTWEGRTQFLAEIDRFLKEKMPPG